jgi:DNA-binding NarL/FixJ family response regulator
MTIENPVTRESASAIVLAHPHALIREGIARILEEAGFRVLGRVDTWSGLEKLVSHHKPTTVLLDWEIAETHTDMVQSFSKKYPDALIIVLTKPHASESFMQAIAAGARGYLSLNLSPEDFVQSLQMVIRGSLVVSDEMSGETEKMTANHYQLAAKEILSEREVEVLTSLGRGSSNREIAEELIISEHTVKVHLRTILNKLNLRNRQQAAARAMKMGLLKDIKTEENQDRSS